MLDIYMFHSHLQRGPVFENCINCNVEVFDRTSHISGVMCQPDVDLKVGNKLLKLHATNIKVEIMWLIITGLFGSQKLITCNAVNDHLIESSSILCSRLMMPPEVFSS